MDNKFNSVAMRVLREIRKKYRLTAFIHFGSSLNQKDMSGSIKSIIKQAGLEREEFLKYI